MGGKTTLISFPEIYLEYDVIVTECATIYLSGTNIYFSHSSCVIGRLNFADEFPVILTGLKFFFSFFFLENTTSLISL